MFFFKRKKIVIDAFTTDGSSYEYFSPTRTINYVPDWWKKLPKSTDTPNSSFSLIKTPTAKVCPAIMNFYSKGFTIPLWSDVAIKTDSCGNWEYQYADKKSMLESHGENQLGYNFSNSIELKLVSPWLFVEKTGVDFYFTENTWNIYNVYNQIRILPGVLNFDSNHATNINMFVPKINQEFIIKAGTSLMNIVPLSEHDCEIKSHLIDSLEYEKIRSRTDPISFDRSYMNKKKIKKCPFHFN